MARSNDVDVEESILIQAGQDHRCDFPLIVLTLAPPGARRNWTDLDLLMKTDSG